MVRPNFSSVVLGIFLFVSSLPAAFGQSCFVPNGGCSPPEQPGQCFPDAAGPITWTDPGGPHPSQVRFLPDSPSSACHPPVGIGSKPHCCTSFHPPGSSAPSVKLRIVG